jgi:hypothetical protein
MLSAPDDGLELADHVRNLFVGPKVPGRGGVSAHRAVDCQLGTRQA